MADFGLWAQLYEAATDPTPGAIMRASAPRVMGWVERMLSPKAEGGFETLSALAPTLMPLLAQEVGALFLPWSAANAAAIGRNPDDIKVLFLCSPIIDTTMEAAIERRRLQQED